MCFFFISISFVRYAMRRFWCTSYVSGRPHYVSVCIQSHCGYRSDEIGLLPRPRSGSNRVQHGRGRRHCLEFFDGEELPSAVLLYRRFPHFEAVPAAKRIGEIAGLKLNAPGAA